MSGRAWSLRWTESGVTSVSSWVASVSLPWTLTEARLVRRYKRFLADIDSELVIHCPNTGAMTGLAEPGSRIGYEPRTGGKTAGRWVLVETAGGWACIDSQRANHWVKTGLASGLWPGFDGMRWKAEVKLDDSRVDFFGQNADESLWLEVKGVTLLTDETGRGAFPDAKSVRAHKHLDALRGRVAAGERAGLMYVLMHNGINRVEPAVHIDPVYGEKVEQARAEGVEFYQLPAKVGLHGVELGVPTRLP